MKKRTVIGVFLAVIILFIGIVFLGQIKNTNYFDDLNRLEAWDYYDYEFDYNNNKVSDIVVVDEGYVGKAILISSNELNDVRIWKNIEVKPNKKYKVSAMVKAETYGGYGANFSAINCSERYDIANTDGKWVEHTYYLKTAANQNNIDFSLGLGGYDGVSIGYVYFDNFSITEVSTIPDEVEPITFVNVASNPRSNTPLSFISRNIFFICVVALILLIVYVFNRKSDEVVSKFRFNKKDCIIVLVLTILCVVISFYRLGDNYSATSYYKAGESGEYVIVELEDFKNITRMVHLGNIINNGYYNISYSLDGENFEDAFTIGENIDNETEFQKSKSSFWSWCFDEWVDFYCKYIKIEAIEPGWAINELAFFESTESGYSQVKCRVIEESYSDKSIGTPSNLFDEQDIVPEYSDYMNSTYFDEIYYPRTAYEQLNGLPLYEITHPPFGKILISIGILMFGMNPFGWRFMGTLCGVLMIPLMYFFAKKIFNNRKYAIFAALLVIFDFMHFTQTRIATIDSFSAFFVLLMYFFMFDYFTNSDGIKFFELKDKSKMKEFMKSMLPLFLCGVSFGFGVATKWSCAYAGAGLALAFFAKKFFEFFNNRKNKRFLGKWIKNNLLPTCTFCIIFFVIIPLIIYTLTYLVYMPSNPDKSLIEVIVDNQKYMYDYHSNLEDSHQFESNWYTWPLNIRPVWYWVGYYFSEGQYSTISTFGNPAVWIPSTFAIILSILFIIKDKDKRALLLLIAFSFQYLPWLLITRCTFIYAYFIPVQFAILLLVYCIEKISRNRKWTNLFLGLYLAVIVGLFVMFFPAISGIPTTQEYINTLKWLPTWNL